MRFTTSCTPSQFLSWGVLSFLNGHESRTYKSQSIDIHCSHYKEQRQWLCTLCKKREKQNFHWTRSNICDYQDLVTFSHINARKCMTHIDKDTCHVDITCESSCIVHVYNRSMKSLYGSCARRIINTCQSDRWLTLFLGLFNSIHAVYVYTTW